MTKPQTPRARSEGPAPGYSYSLVDRFGTTHVRYSARHLEPIYTYAIVRYGLTLDGRPCSPGKAGVAFTSRQALAEAEAARYQAYRAKWKMLDLVDVIAVTATPGRARPQDAA